MIPLELWRNMSLNDLEERFREEERAAGGISETGNSPSVRQKPAEKQEKKAFITELLEIPFGGLMKNPKKSLRWGVILVVIAAALFALVLREPLRKSEGVRHAKDGARIRL